MSIKRFTIKLLVIFLSQVLLAVIATKTYLVYTNTLEVNDNWLVTKNDLEMKVIGSTNYYTDRQALAFEKLNLGAWHGFQEVLYKYMFNPSRVSFDVFIPEKGYLYFIFNKNY